MHVTSSAAPLSESTSPDDVVFLSTADWIVPSPARAAGRVAAAIGSPPPRERDVLATPTHPFSSQFARTSNQPWSLLPTRLQFLEPTAVVESDGCSTSPAPGLIAAQTGRQQRVHATVLVVTDDALEAIAERSLAPLLVEDPCEHFGWRRVWIGWDRDENRVEGHDAGLFVELVPVSAFGEEIARQATALNVGDFAGQVRVSERIFAVDDLDRAAAELDRSIGLVPSEAGTGLLDPDAAFRRYSFAHPGSATIALVEPTPDGLTGALAGGRPGLIATSIVVSDVESAVERAVSAGFVLLSKAVVEDPETGIVLNLEQALK